MAVAPEKHERKILGFTPSCSCGKWHGHPDWVGYDTHRAMIKGFFKWLFQHFAKLTWEEHQSPHDFVPSPIFHD